MKIEKLSLFKKIILGIQMLFVAFGAVVLVPLLVGIDPSVALFCAGVGTLIFHLITRGKVPIFLGSSFVFIAPVVKATELYGFAGTLSGLIAVGVTYVLVSLLVRKRGIGFIQKIFPNVVIGPVIMIIGLTLASVGIEMASTNWGLAFISLFSAVLVIVFGKKTLKLLPVIAGISVGYIVGIIFKKVNFRPLLEAPWFSLPAFTFPAFNIHAILFLVPVAIAPIIEHIGDMYAISKVAKKDFVKDPGIKNTMLGDGLATIFAGMVGGTPITTYSEVTGAITLTKITDPLILRIAAITAVILAFVGKMSGFLRTIPEAVLGGIMILLFGMISVVGIQTLMDSKINLNKTKNMVIVSVMLIMGVGGAMINIGKSFSFGGIALASVVGVFLNLILPDKENE